MIPKSQAVSGNIMLHEIRKEGRMSVLLDGIVPAQAAVASPLRPAYFIWAALALALMSAAIVSENLWFLNFVHVVSGLMWTGIDLFMGFVVGPILRRMSAEQKRPVVVALLPRTLILMPVLSIMTGTSGWFLARHMGYLDLAYPEFFWIVAALAILVVLTIQGLAILLPTNLLVYFEIQKRAMDDAKIARWMRRYTYVVASQGALQIAIIVIMARLRAGL
jgi:hypothetical protein